MPERKPVVEASVERRMRFRAYPWWAALVRWSRVALSVALLAVSVALVKADQVIGTNQDKISQLEHQRQESTERGVRIRERIAHLEKRVARLETTTTGTTAPPVTPRKPTRRSASTTTQVPRTVSTTPRTTMSVPPPRVCRLVIPFQHTCLLSVVLP